MSIPSTAEHGEVRFGDARIRYQVVRSPKRHKTIEVTMAEPGHVTVAAPMDTPAERLMIIRRYS